MTTRTLLREGPHRHARIGRLVERVKKEGGLDRRGPLDDEVYNSFYGA